MKNRRPRSVVPFVLLALAVAATAAAQSDGAGRYRSKGQYRSEGNYRGSQEAWKPSYYHQNKYFQVQPLPSPLGPPFTGSLSRSNLRANFSGNVVIPRPVFPGAGVYVPYAPSYGYEAPPPPPPAPAPAPAPQPQVYIVQPQPLRQNPPAAAPAQVPPPPAAPVSNEPGDLVLSVQPAATLIYINDRLVGSGQSLTDKGEPLVLRPGVYVLEAEHPDFGSQRLIFGVTAEETVRVAIDLSADRPGRRARVETDGGEDFLLN